MKPILNRFLLTIPVVWLVVSLVFLLIHIVPGDPSLQMLGRLHETVARLIASRYPYTIALTFAALGLALVLSLPAGVFAAVRRGRFSTHARIYPFRSLTMLREEKCQRLHAVSF